MHLKLLFKVMAACAAVGVLAWVLLRPLTPAQLVMRTLNPQPGKGLNASDVKTYGQSMAYALYASSAARMGEMNKAVSAADWLLAHTSSPSEAGWGLPVAWDAFGDGSVNPSSTVYGITVAIVVDALFDVFDATQDRKYLRAAERALDEYEQFSQNTDKGRFFWYSDQPTDAIETSNVSAMLMGQYARAAHYFHDERFSKIAREAHSNLIANRRVVNGSWYWTYSAKTNLPNDLVHHALIVKGLIDYRDYLGDETGLKEATNYFQYFYDQNDVYQFPRLPRAVVSDPLLKRQAMVWGIGMAVYVESRMHNMKSAKRFMHMLKKYKLKSGGYGMLPKNKTWRPDMQAYLLYGLSEFEFSH